jgi:lipoprotein-anchoring transpeptidase ErfK/SrfK
VKRFLLLVVALLAAGAFSASVLADTPPPTTTSTTTETTPTDTSTTTTTTTPVQVVPDGVMLAGLSIGGLSSDQAIAVVEEAFGRPLLLRFDRTTISISPSLLGLRVPADTAVARALTVAPGTSLALRAGYDRAAVKKFVAKIAKRFNRKPESSRLLFRHAAPVVTKPVQGRTIAQSRTVLAMEQQLARGTRGTIKVAAAYRNPKVTPTTIGPIIVIKRGSNQLTLFNGPKTVRKFHVATGQNIYPTPLGRFQIVVKWKNPWWYPPASPWAKGLKPVPPGPNNPLGTRWMGISSPGVGIHGTDEPASIGYSLSHGCIRMLVPQAEWLFDHVDVGTPVYIVAA